MGRAVHVDCFSGASGDMLLGALIDAGVEVSVLRHGLDTLPIRGWSLEAERVERHGLSGTHVRVRHDADPSHRGLSEVLTIVRGGGLPEEVVDRACAVFRVLAEVEAHIHGTTPDAVEFHEVGALDAIVDIVGTVFGLHLLGTDWARLSCSGLPLGSGWVNAAHGRLPVPAPATLELLRRVGAPLRPAPADGDVGELTTPTGAALLTTLATFRTRLSLDAIEAIGYGFGTRQPPWPNALRLIVGSAVPLSTGLQRDQVVEIQTNLDDCTAEELGFAMEQLLADGALDVAFSPLQMKKNRPGVLLRVLGRPADAERLTELLLLHTSALGVRLEIKERLIAGRGERIVPTPWGDVRVKVKLLGDRELVAPEYEDCARLARSAQVALRQVYDAARAAADARA